MNNEEVIYFSVNNWFSGRDYPPTDNFKKWLGNDLNQTFRNDEWAKENKLCIYYGCIDMSFNYTIAAPRSWVEKNCPELLTDNEYTYYIIIHQPKRKKLFGGYEYEDVEEEHKKKYSDFVDKPTEDGDLEDRFGWPYLEYKPENFGVHYYSYPNEYYEEDEEEDDDEIPELD